MSGSADPTDAQLDRIMEMSVEELAESEGMTVEQLREEGRKLKERMLSRISMPDDDCEDQGFTAMPKKCTRWQCDRMSYFKDTVLKNEGGFMVCPTCGGSYGPAPTVTGE